MSNLIVCPNCQHSFSLDEVQEHRRKEMEVELEKKLQSELKADADKRALAWAQEQIAKARLDADEASKKQSIELDSLRKRDEEARRKEIEFLRQSQEYDDMKRNQEVTLERAKMEERKKVEEEYVKEIQDKVRFELQKQDLETEKRLRAKDEQIAQMQRSIEDAKRKGEQGSMQIQ